MNSLRNLRAKNDVSGRDFAKFLACSKLNGHTISLNNGNEVTPPICAKVVFEIGTRNEDVAARSVHPGREDDTFSTAVEIRNFFGECDFHSKLLNVEEISV